MNLPGFDADASLYMTGRHYRTGGSFNPGTGSTMRGIEPALSIFIDGRFVCDGEVTDNGFISCNPIGVGGVGPGPDPSARICRSCLSGCARKPVSQRADCRQNCLDNIC